MKCLKTTVCLGVWQHVKTQKNILMKNNYYMQVITFGNKVNN